LEKSKYYLMKKKPTIIIGYQKAALSNLSDYINYIFKKKIKIKLILPNKFNANIIYRKNIKNFDILDKLKLTNNFQIILGTSEKPFESNIAKYLDNKKLHFWSYIDSLPNLKLRYKNYKNKPNNILVTNNLIIKDYKKIFPKEFENTEFSNLNMPYQRYLKKKYYNYKRKNNFIIYVSSNLNIKEELKGINKLLNSKFYIPNKKIYFLLHPRENIKKWRQLNRDFKNIKLIKKQKYYSSNNYKYVFGITTAALINYKFIGCETYFFNVLKNDKIYDVFNTYGIKQLR